MAGTKEYFFEPVTLLRLLTHYTDGQVPLDGEVTDFLANPHLQRKIGLVIASDEWETADPLFLLYDGKRIASWAKNDGHDHMVWEQKNETPKRQA